ncbi:PD-(D/E)XK nuclease family protein [Helicobacter sp. MIT 99-5507]|uniref:PD-(D/E)XK nuclease family protein n=1 Tax=Helicobacter sp. MIT 99-5507 TaxID=152489 RepID=UPI000E1EFF0E|nr:PD-(D/E)XK nuclease family protein [Helicobacter sp. MIT 99-5507]RDU58600.1 hypothetical protein CQA42_02120 [Helicobacter sp. MIT 99-5507]
MRLFIFPTNRALNNFYINYKDSILPDATTIGSFFEEIIIVNGKSKIPKKLRKIILWDIISRFEVEKIGFDKTFLRFLENSSFLFNFFDEIESANIDIKNIDISDTYGDYEDHLRILNNIYNAYKKRLDELNLYDNPTEYRLNTAYIKYYKHIEIYIDGLLSNKDFNLIKEIAKYSNIDLIFECSKYNKTIFEKLFNQRFKIDIKYTISINTNKIKDQISLDTKKPNISIYSFSLRLNQALLVIAKINEWLKNGIENIAVILPSEDFKKYLKLFDKAKNLNYAMGLEDSNTISKIRNLELKIDNSKSKLLNIIENIGTIKENLKDELLELTRFENLFENLDYNDILEFIINNIKNIDDTHGGKVKVIGILETRGIAFDKIIIVDFNDEFLPKINDNDIFINSNIRKRVNLPTINDKENLQRHYYANLINNANEVCIAFDANKIRSNLLDDFELYDVIDGESLWSFFPKNLQKEYKEDEIIANFEDKNLSATKIKTFLDCKRKFYFCYIAKLAPDEIDIEDTSAFIGNVVHDILKDLGDDFKIESFKKALKIREMNILNRIDMESLIFKIKPFIESNYEILQKNRQILNREFEFKYDIFGFAFSGRIDRIDKDKNEIHIIDYKIKNNFDIKKERYLQLLIYKKAISEIYKDYYIKAAYYDVLNDKLHYMDSKDEQAEEEILQEVLTLLKIKNINFEKTNNSSICHYCDYKHLCDMY